MLVVVTIIDFVVIIVLCIWCNDKSLLHYNSELKLEVGGGILHLLVVYFCWRAYFVITVVMI